VALGPSRFRYSAKPNRWCEVLLVVVGATPECQQQRDDRQEEQKGPDGWPNRLGDTRALLHRLDALARSIGRDGDRDEQEQEPREDGENRDPGLDRFVAKVAPSLVVDLVVPDVPVTVSVAKVRS
jgi:hypothetical protein